MSPEKGYMFDIRPSRVSLVKRPANRREFLVTKSEEELVMDEIIQIIKGTKAENEETLIEALKSEGKDEGTIQAALSVYRTLSAFRDSLSETDFNSIAKALEVKTVEDLATEENIVKDDEEEVVEKTEEETVDETTETVEKTEEEVEDTEEVVEKSDDESTPQDDKIAELEKTILALTTKHRDDELRAMVTGLHVGKSEDELFDILKSQDEAGADIGQVVGSWQSASTVVDSALTEIGSELPGVLNKTGGDALDVEAARIASEKNISTAAAYAQLPAELVAQYYADEKTQN